MNPYDVMKILEEFRKGSSGVDAVFVAVLTKNGVYKKEGGNLFSRARLRRELKRNM